MLYLTTGYSSYFVVFINQKRLQEEVQGNWGDNFYQIYIFHFEKNSAGELLKFASSP